ncbi:MULTISPECIES: PhoH family protein [Chromobacterium]|uniref:PhoH family protein n=1 Tax=Chromobacterium phragmitis TaxID=2202141 RepID=A0ABV0J0H5_9NEIS|nr:PhoH family protein [Chromobacterium sp. ASV23]
MSYGRNRHNEAFNLKRSKKRGARNVAPDLCDVLTAIDAVDRPGLRQITQPLQPRTERQRRYLGAMRESVITFGMGPAGTGKTYVCGAYAADELAAARITKIIITRPAVEAGEKLGYLPGELEDKYAPYLAPFRDVLDERLGKSHVDLLLKRGRIEASPLAYMRGRTFRDAFVILDEAQNTTPEQMRMFLTRIGENCRVVVNGDVRQQDIKGQSGLADAAARLGWIPQVSIVEFTAEDIVRSDIVSDIIQSYDKDCPQR